MTTFPQDLKYGIRMLVNKPGFTAAAVLVLALGIGANSAVFSLVNAFLLKPLAVREPEQLSGLYSRDVKHPDVYRAFSYPNYLDIRENHAVFSSLMAHTLAMVGITEGETTRRAFAGIVSSNYFSTLGVSPLLGRTFTPEEEKPGAAGLPVIVSHPFWKRTGRNPQLLGSPLRINGRVFNVVGIMPEGFSGTTALVSPDVWVPLGVYSLAMNDFETQGKPLTARDNASLILVGRYREGMSQDAATAPLAVLSSQMEQAYPALNKDQALLVRPLSRLSVSTNPTDDSSMRVPAILLLSLSAVVLLIASLNLSNMMLARGAARRKEIAIRLAIGGGRGRIVRQLITEGMLLALLGGAGGLLLASWSTTLLIASLQRLAPLDLVYQASPDIRVAGATLAFCGLSTVVFALFPAWKLSKPDVWFDLKENTGEDVAGGARRLFTRGNLLVMGQLSLSLMMLTAAGLFIRSAMRAADVRPGFSISNEVIAETDPSLINYDEARGRRVYAEVTERVRRLPGVQSVGLAATAPFGMVTLGKNIVPAGTAASKENPGVSARYNVVTGEYFGTLGIPLLRGRSFTAAESGAGAKSHVAVLDQLAAAKLWPGGEALGKRIRLDEGGAGGGIGISTDGAEARPEDLEVVGVVGNIREGILWSHGPSPHVYVPFGQNYLANMQIHVKTAPGVPETQILEAVRREIRATDERLPMLTLRTMRGHLEAGADLWVVRTGATMLEIFGGVALFLAVIGLYAVNSYTVSRRTREIGIRMALGADAGTTLGMVLREGLRVTAAGIGLGLLLAVGLSRVLAGMLYEVGAFDPVVLGIAPLLLGSVALLACYVPARRAARVDPMVALRCE